MLKHKESHDLHHMKEAGETYQLQEKITVLEEQVNILKTAIDALKENNDSLKEIKELLQKRIDTLEQ